MVNPMVATGAIEAVATRQPAAAQMGGVSPRDLLSDPMVLKAIGATALYFFGGEDRTMRMAAFALAAWAAWDYLHRPRTTVQTVVGPDGRLQPQTIVQAPVLRPAWQGGWTNLGPAKPGALRAEAAERDLREAAAQREAAGAVRDRCTDGRPVWRYPDGHVELDLATSLFGGGPTSTAGMPGLKLV